MADRPRALFAMRSEHLPAIFPPPVMRRLARLADIDGTLVAERFDDPRLAAVLPAVEVLVTGWGCPPLDEDALERMPRLRAALHAAGSVKSHVTAACWEREIIVTSAAHANAVPVAEYALAAILFAGKGIFGLHEGFHARRTFTIAAIHPDVGNLGRKVGIVGASSIGRRVIALLRLFDVEVHLTDPYVSPAEAGALGVRLLGLDELLSTVDVVSLHAPDNAATRHLLDRRRLALLRDGAVLVNTARGGLVDTAALIGELRAGRISAVLDVTEPEPLPPDSPLFTLPNVFLTPHIAGAHGNELERLGVSVVDELERLTAGRPLEHQVKHADWDRVA